MLTGGGYSIPFSKGAGLNLIWSLYASALIFYSSWGGALSSALIFTYNAEQRMNGYHNQAKNKSSYLLIIPLFPPLVLCFQGAGVVPIMIFRHCSYILDLAKNVNGKDEID